MNGRPFGPISPEQSVHEIALDVLGPMNELVLEVEPPVDGSDWGIISLIFHPAS